MGYKTVKEQIRKEETLKYAQQVWESLSERQKQNIGDSIEW